MVGNIDLLPVYKEAVELESMTYISQEHLPKKFRYNLWLDVIKNAGNICDGICDAYHIPNEDFDSKARAVVFALSNLAQIERRTTTANNMQALCDKNKALYDIKIHSIRKNLLGWLNSLQSKLSQNDAGMPATENS